MEFKQYSSYKNSGVEWLGDVPEHWGMNRLGVHFRNRKEKVSDKNFNPLSVTKHGIVPQLEHAAKSDNGDNRKLVRKGDYVINSRSDRKGSSGLADLDGSVSLINIVLTPFKTIHPKFSHYLLRSYLFQEEFYKYGHGIVADLWTTNYEDMRNIHLALPSVSEQTQISNFLEQETTRIDNLISKQEKLIELLEEQRKSIISHAVTKGLNPNAPMKDSGVEWLGEVPESWVEQKIKFISKLINEKTSEKSNVIALENIESWTGKYIETESSFESDAVKFKKNDVLFGKLRPYLAKVYLVENQGEAVGDIYVLRPNNLINPKFLKFFMLSEKFIDYVNSSTNGTKMPRANWDFIGCISIFLPHIKVQHEIVEYLESAVLKIELIINKQISLIEKLKEYRSSIISHAVTGKIDVREFGT
ncbi:restriction endonuclease subunit S [Uruburuella suis]|uniref:restriction endonuclease subunit S n=1 Tax=Uruburuella suis TaxID=252130 RepID=UPI0024908329|nr:restriction endonuclease subunit S [Uruburuella suis]